MIGRILGTVLVFAMSAIAADSAYTPLWLYEGTWRVTKKDAKPDELVNRCAEFSKYLACEQTVNGAVSSLVVFVPTSTAGQYHMQSIMPDGRAGGLGQLVISGNTWTYTNSWNQGGGTVTYYKTTNVFSGKDRIHYEQQESSDRTNWKTTGSGDEVRIAPGRMTIAR